MRLLLPPPLLLAAVVGAASPHNSPRAWPNVLDERDTWLFDYGSNFGWRALETRGGQHALVGPAPDWSLGNRAVPSLEVEVDVLLGDGPASVAAGPFDDAHAPAIEAACPPKGQLQRRLVRNSHDEPLRGEMSSNVQENGKIKSNEAKRNY